MPLFPGLGQPALQMTLYWTPGREPAADLVQEQLRWHGLLRFGVRDEIEAIIGKNRAAEQRPELRLIGHLVHQHSRQKPDANPGTDHALRFFEILGFSRWLP